MRLSAQKTTSAINSLNVKVTETFLECWFLRIFFGLIYFGIIMNLHCYEIFKSHYFLIVIKVMNFVSYRSVSNFDAFGFQCTEF